MMTRDNDGDECLTITVPEAGRKLGISRNASYEAAARGYIPTIRIGRILRVPISAFERLLDGAGGDAKGGRVER